MLKCRDDMHESIAAIGRTSAVELFRAGRALSIAKGKLKVTKGWEQWLKDNKLPKTTAFEAVKLFTRAKTETAVASMSITTAKIRYGVAKTKAPRPPNSDDSHEPQHRPISHPPRNQIRSPSHWPRLSKSSW